MKSFSLKLAAVFCAISLWFFVVSAKTYQVEVDIPLQLKGVPTLLALASHVPKTIRANIEGTGLDLIRLQHQQNIARFSLDLSKAKLGVQTISLSASHFSSPLKRIRLVGITNEATVEIHLDTRISLEVPIRLHQDPKPAKGYLLIGEPVLIPNTVILSGARKTLTRIFEVSTSQVDLSELQNTDTIDVPLSLEGLSTQADLALSHVRLAFQVEKKKSRTFSNVPVQFVGPYQRERHRIEPDHVNVTISGGESILDEMTTEDIRLFVEFTRFELERSDSISPTAVIEKVVESWAISPAMVHLKEKAQ